MEKFVKEKTRFTFLTEIGGIWGLKLLSRGPKKVANIRLFVSNNKPFHPSLIPTKIHCIQFVYMNLAIMSSLQMCPVLDAVSVSPLHIDFHC